MSSDARLAASVVLDVDVTAVSPLREHKVDLPVSPALDRVAPGGAEREGRAALWSPILNRASDERLLERARGDERAFQVLMERYRPRLLVHCASIAGEAGAQDAVQQAFINVWYALRRGYEVESVRPWLFTIARRAALQVRTQHAPTHELPTLLAGGRTPEEQFELSRRARSALAAVAGLPPIERDALVETSIQGRSGRDIAHALGISETATRQLIFRARARARAAFGAWVPAAFLARLPSHAGRGVRRVLSLARHSAAGASSIEASDPLLRLAPLVVSGVLVAAPVAAVVLVHQHESPARARQALAARHAHAPPSAARAKRGTLAQQGSPLQARGTVRFGALAAQGGSGRIGLSGGARGAAQAPLGREPAAGVAPPSAATNAPAAAHAPLSTVVAPAGTAATGALAPVKQLAPTAAAAEGVEKGVAGVAGLGREALEHPEAPALNLSQTPDSTAHPQTAVALP
jgi:RNA polymerase sigma-70 factor (ECF subfamily)